MYECGVNVLDAPAESMRALEEIMRTAADDVPLADSRHVIEVDAEPDPSNSDFGDAMRDFEQGRALLAQGHIDLAVDCLRRAASALPPSIEIYEALGEALYLQGDSAGAASAFDQALRLQEESQT
jgi:Flp pilus assembly protein TadD